MRSPQPREIIMVKRIGQVCRFNRLAVWYRARLLFIFRREKQHSGQENGKESYTALALLFVMLDPGRSAICGCCQNCPASGYAQRRAGR